MSNVYCLAVSFVGKKKLYVVQLWAANPLHEGFHITTLVIEFGLVKGSNLQVRGQVLVPVSCKTLLALNSRIQMLKTNNRADSYQEEPALNAHNEGLRTYTISFLYANLFVVVVAQSY